MKTYRIKEVTEILNINRDAVHSYIRKALPESMKPKMTMQEGLGRETYEFTEDNIDKLKKAISLKKTGLTYKLVKGILVEAEEVKEVSKEVVTETKPTEESEEVMGMDLTVINQDGKLLVDSREVARMIDKRHDHLMRDIKGYIDVLDDTPNLGSPNFFIESTYINTQNKEQPCYLLTRKGCDMVANKMTGEKGIIFTATYVTQFEKMEKALQQVYHVSETAIVNSVMGAIEEKIFTGIDERLAKYEENYRPTHANKISINSYIKKGLGELQEDGEVDLVKERVLFLLNAEAWQDIPYERFVKSIKQVDESIRAVKSFRTRSQLSLFEQAN